MAFLETPRFPDCHSFGSTAGPQFQTSRAVVDSGVEYGNKNWEQALRRYQVSFDARRPKVVNDLLAFFHNMAGTWGYFRFKDWTDYRDNDFDKYAISQAAGVMGVIDATHYQLYKRYTVGSLQFNRPIQKPVVNKITITGGTVSAIDYTTGIVTMSSGTPTAWEGEFDVPVRFDTDVMRAVILNKNLGVGLITGWQSIDLVEVRLA